MASPGDVVVVQFQGAVALKRRPAVVTSGMLYHQHRPDHVVGILTSQLQSATAPTDHLLQDWLATGLRGILKTNGAPRPIPAGPQPTAIIENLAELPPLIEQLSSGPSADHSGPD